MMGCQPQAPSSSSSQLSHQQPHHAAGYSLAPAPETLPPHHRVSSAAALYAADHHHHHHDQTLTVVVPSSAPNNAPVHHAAAAPQLRHYRTDLAPVQVSSYLPVASPSVSATPQVRFPPQHSSQDSLHHHHHHHQRHQQGQPPQTLQFSHLSETVTSHPQHCSRVSAPPLFARAAESTSPQYKGSESVGQLPLQFSVPGSLPQQQQLTASSQRQQFAPTAQQLQPSSSAEQQQQQQLLHFGPSRTPQPQHQLQHKSVRHPETVGSQQQHLLAAETTNPAQRPCEVTASQQQQQHLQPRFTVHSSEPGSSRLSESSPSHQRLSPQSEQHRGVVAQASVQQQQQSLGVQQFQQYRQPPSSSPQHQKGSYQLSPTAAPSATMLDKKPTLQVLTTDHSPVSPNSNTSSPRFIFPDMQASSSSGRLGSDSGSSPFMSPIKREVQWEVGTPPELDAGQQTPRERIRMHSGDTEPNSETLVDSETGSSLLDDSGSSREQSPFSAMAESLSLRSPSDLSPSPLARKVFQRQTVTVTSEDDEELGEDGEGGGGQGQGADGDFHPSKFKKRLHERYVLSLQDTPSIIRREFKEEAIDQCESGEGDSPHPDLKSQHPYMDLKTPYPYPDLKSPNAYPDSKRPVSKMERPDSPSNPDSPMPKSPRRSSSDTEVVRTESADVGASSADEGDVFMEPTLRVSGRPAKHKPPSLRHQREPLDLSRGPIFYSPGFRSSSSSSPLVIDPPDYLSPAASSSSNKMFSPVFRSPHNRLPYSPHGMLSPQSQSPLCSVPEGGRIFNFNMPSPLEGAHSDSDLISPSPMSPRVFTFPPPGAVLSSMVEVNRLAVSPRAPYTPPLPGMPGSKGYGVAGLGGDQQAFYAKRSLSESDMTYLCPVCGQAFPTNDNLAKHMAKHLPSETVRGVTGPGGGDGSNKVHYCKVCNRSFSRSDMLTRHMRLHTGLKPYECLDCGQVFSRSDHLNTHRRTHTGEKPYRCPHCPYAACRRDMITRHMRTHAKRTSRRARYLSVPDDSEGHKGSGGSVSSETSDSHDYAPAGRGQSCSISSVDSVESESLLSVTSKTYMATSVDSLLSPDPDLLTLGGGHHSSASSSRKPSEDPEEGLGLEGGLSPYDSFMRYRKARNWSTTSLESVDSEEALSIREALVDEAFHEPDFFRTSGGGGDEGGKGGGGGGGKVGMFSSSSSSSSFQRKDLVGLDTKTLQKCFISPHPPGSGSSSGS